MLSLWRRLMSGELTPVQIAALTMGLRVKKETIGEIAAAAQIMREFSTKVERPTAPTWSISAVRAGDAAHTSTSPRPRCRRRRSGCACGQAWGARSFVRLGQR